MVTRLLADSVRLFATAIPLALITGWPYPVSIAVIGVLTLVYTYIGGIKAVVWVDALQMGLYMVGAVVAIAMLQALVPGGWGEILSSGSAAGKMAVLDFSFDLALPYTFWAGLVGGAFLTMGSHGTDQLLVQRLLTCRNLKASQRALVGSAFGVMVQFVLFLAVGLGLWVFYEGRAFERSDEIFALFIVQQLPPGVAGLLVAGVFAAAMSSLSSSINSLASASAYDFWAPAKGAEDDEARILRAGKIFTLIWAVLLVGGAVLFIPLSRGTAAVEVALGIASAVYGGLIGAFALGIFSPRSDQRSVSLGIVAGIGVVMVIWLTMPERVAWPWFAVIGTAVTYLVGAALGRDTRRSLP
jgi:Na+/proline symporter